MDVVNSTGDISKFQPKIIKEHILYETDLDEEKAENIKNRIARKVNNIDGINQISTAQIRDMINYHLTKDGLFDTEKQSRKLGLSVSALENLIDSGNKDNANINFGPEQVVKYASDAVLKEYALLTMPEECSKAYTDGYIHIHDMEAYNIRPANCISYDIRFFIKNGLKIDGQGINCSCASPAKSLNVLLNHLLQAFMAGSTVLSGGQGYPYFNIFLAPFAEGLTYEEVKQCIQNFIFNCNMSLISKGQVVFSSVGLELDVPPFMRDLTAYGPGGREVGVYNDYKKEARMIIDAFIEVLYEGDAKGKCHIFPNTLFNLRDEFMGEEYDELLLNIHELIAKFPTPYFINQDLPQNGTATTVMGALTSDTPVMTDKGFKYPQELQLNDNVMTYNKDGTKEWNKVINIIKKPVSEKVFKITCNNGYIFKVTDNHKLPTKDGIIKSENLKVGMELYNYIDEPFIPVDDLEYEFIGAFLADGYIRSNERALRNSNAIEFHIKLNWKKEYITNLCDKLGYKYDITKQNNGTYSINIRELNIRDKLVQLYTKNGEKTFPQCWSDKNKIANIIKGLMLDAHKQSNNYVWSCSDKNLVTDVLYALSYIGRQNTLYIDNRKGKTNNWKPNYRVTFGINYSPKNNTIIKDIEVVNNDDNVYDLTIENNHNYVCGLGGIHSENCRTANGTNWTGNWEIDTLNVGNFAYITFNLPRMAYISNNMDEFKQYLEHFMNIGTMSMLDRKQNFEDRANTEGYLGFLLQEDKYTGKPLYDISNFSFTFGTCGLYEAVKMLTGYDLDTPEGNKYGEEILEFMNEYSKKQKAKYGLRFACLGSPAESCSHRFAEIDKKIYPDILCKGVEGGYYYTNSNHLPVDSQGSIIEHIKNANTYHKYEPAGCILNCFLGEAYMDPQSLMSLTKKIKKQNIQFWAYTSAFTVCKECGKQANGDNDSCIYCGSENVYSMSRITGYFTVTQKWNAGKKQELKDRVNHND